MPKAGRKRTLRKMRPLTLAKVEHKKVAKKARGTNHGSATPGFSSSQAMEVSSLVPRNMFKLQRASPFPAKKRVTLRYSDNFQSTAAAAAPYVWQNRINSCNDPDFTFTGHQPRFYDQYCSATGPYLAYRVLGGRIRLEVSLSDNSNSIYFPALMVAGFAQSSTVPAIITGGTGAATIWPLVELPGWSGATITNFQKQVLSFQYTTAEIAGVPEKTVQTDDLFQAAYNANPTNAMFWTFLIQAADGVNTVYFDATVTIEMDVQFEAPFMTAAS